MKGAHIDLTEEVVHNFEKTNNFTLKDKQGYYDTYRCTKCGAEGKRYGVGNPNIIITKGKKKHRYHCTNKPTTFYPDILEILEPVSFNGKTIPAGAKVATIECPEDQREKFYFHVWIKAPKFGISELRLLKGEYKFLTK